MVVQHFTWNQFLHLLSVNNCHFDTFRNSDIDNFQPSRQQGQKLTRAKKVVIVTNLRSSKSPNYFKQNQSGRNHQDFTWNQFFHIYMPWKQLQVMKSDWFHENPDPESRKWSKWLLWRVLNSPKSISRKILMVEKLPTFHTVNLQQTI